MRDSWKRAFDTFEEEKDDSNDYETMQMKQREINQQQWNNSIAKAADKSLAEEKARDNDPELETVSWAKMYKNTPEEVKPEEIELSIEEQVLHELEKTGFYHKVQGLVGSVRMLCVEVKTLRNQLKAIKRSLGH